MTYTVLTYGDSNTHGTPPLASRDPHPRLKRRWPVVMAKASGVDLIEEGLPGRLAAGHGDPLMGAHMDGQLGLRIALASHGPIDLLTIMLGSNDVQSHHGKSAAQIASHIDALTKMALDADVQDRHNGFQLLIICPPVAISSGTFATDFVGAKETSAALPPLYARIAQNRGLHFMNAGAHITSSPIDGVHFDEAAHETLGQAVADQVKTILT